MASEASRSVPGAVDPDVDLHISRQRRELGAHPVAVLGSISAGGVVGALARYGLGEVLPRDPGGWPWATWAVNVAGCVLIGVLMVLISEVWTGQRLLRLFLGVGACPCRGSRSSLRHRRWVRRAFEVAGGGGRWWPRRALASNWRAGRR